MLRYFNHPNTAGEASSLPDQGVLFTEHLQWWKKIISQKIEVALVKLNL